jgi:RNase adaptor protein for sRNA GlmZ degradation
LTNRTVIITFGYRHGDAPPADMTVDLRDVNDHDYSVWEKEAESIAQEIEPGTVVALGCRDGDDRSVHIARLIQKHLDHVVVVDRDLGPDAASGDE